MPIITDHPANEQPTNPGAAVWRFIDFTKLVWMFERRSLFFARADTLNDPFEGSFPSRHAEKRHLWYGNVEGLNADFWETELPAIFREQPRYTFVNCWHMGEHESAAMWSLYAHGGHGIAVRTTYAKLVTALQDCPYQIFPGVVKYVDYAEDIIPEGNVLLPFFYKRRSFEHEHEVRIVLRDAEYDRAVREEGAPEKPGVIVPVNLDELIERIYVAPQSPTWFHDLVRDVLKRYALDHPIVVSALGGDPVF